MDKEHGVTDDASPASEVQTEVPTAPAAVTAETGRPERPVENIKAEFDRKLARTQQQLDQVLAYLANQQQVRQPSQPRAEVTEDDLWALAQQGDRNAFDEYMDRKAQRRVSQSLTANARVQQTQKQIDTLMQKFPMFRDPSNALTQTAQQFLTLYGGNINDPDAVLKAMLSAVAERDDIVAEHRGQTSRASEQQRRSAGQVAQSGQTGASHRAAPVNTSKLKWTKEEEELAKRMGVKDGLGAKKRFLERNASGQSTLGAVASMVNLEDF